MVFSVLILTGILIPVYLFDMESISKTCFAYSEGVALTLLTFLFLTRSLGVHIKRTKQFRKTATKYSYLVLLSNSLSALSHISTDERFNLWVENHTNEKLLVGDQAKPLLNGNYDTLLAWSIMINIIAIDLFRNNTILRNKKVGYFIYQVDQRFFSSKENNVNYNISSTEVSNIFLY